MHRFSLTLAAIGLGLVLVAHSASFDAMARTRHARTRLHAPQEMQSLSVGERMPHAKIRVRARRRGTEMTVAVRRLEADADHLLYCDALGDEPIPFTTNRRGRARLRGISADAGERGEMFDVEVHDADGFVVLEGDIEHPGHHGEHGRERGHMESDERHSLTGDGAEHQPGVRDDDSDCDDPLHEHLGEHSHADDEAHDDSCDGDHEQGSGDAMHGQGDESHGEMPGHADEDAPHDGGRLHDDSPGGASGHTPHHG